MNDGSEVNNDLKNQARMVLAMYRDFDLRYPGKFSFGAWLKQIVHAIPMNDRLPFPKKMLA